MQQELGVVQEFLQAAETKNIGKMRSLMANNLVFVTKFGKAGKSEFINFMEATSEAMPDQKALSSSPKLSGETIVANLGFVGTHTKPFDPRIAGVKTAPPSGKEVRLEPEAIYFVVKNGKIVKIYPEPGHEGGVVNTYKALGVKLPPLTIMRLVTHIKYLFRRSVV